MTEEEKKTITQKKHPERVAQGHKLAALMKKKKEILRNKEQSTVQSTEQSTEQSNDTYIYGVGILAVLAIGVCVFFIYNTFQSKNLINDRLAAQHEQKQPPKRRHML